MAAAATNDLMELDDRTVAIGMIRRRAKIISCDGDSSPPRSYLEGRSRGSPKDPAQ